MTTLAFMLSSSYRACLGRKHRRQQQQEESVQMYQWVARAPLPRGSVDLFGKNNCQGLHNVQPLVSRSDHQQISFFSAPLPTPGNGQKNNPWDFTQVSAMPRPSLAWGILQEIPSALTTCALLPPPSRLSPRRRHPHALARPPQVAPQHSAPTLLASRLLLTTDPPELATRSAGLRIRQPSCCRLPTTPSSAPGYRVRSRRRKPLHPALCVPPPKTAPPPTCHPAASGFLPPPPPAAACQLQHNNQPSHWVGPRA